MLVDVFEIFRTTCLKIYELELDRFPSAPGLAWLVALETTEVKLYLLTDADMLLMVSVEEYVTLLIGMLKLITNT